MIDVQSEVGKGTKVTVIFPIKSASSPAVSVDRGPYTVGDSLNGGIVDSPSSLGKLGTSLTIDSTGSLNYGGIDFNGINVKSSVDSNSVVMPAIDLKNFEGMTFRIVKLEKVEDVAAISKA